MAFEVFPKGGREWGGRAGGGGQTGMHYIAPLRALHVILLGHLCTTGLHRHCVQGCWYVYSVAHLKHSVMQQLTKCERGCSVWLLISLYGLDRYHAMLWTDVATATW